MSKYFPYTGIMEEYPHLNKALACVLSRKRVELGMTKLRMSELIHMERAYITALERGTKRPTLNAVFFICDDLGMSRQEFMAEIEAEMKILDKREG
jgi:transcriptional regulator with XRE-family HTH domain